MKLQFIGAAQEVTGSCTLLELDGRHYLIDCGMEQGMDVFQNVPLPVSAGDIDAVFLTHAHIDHSGMLPRLYKDGFRGVIYATKETVKLSDIMLRDSAHIQMTEALWRNRKAQRAGEEQFAPTYSIEDAHGAIKLFRGVNYNEKVTVAAGLDLRFSDIGHLLGSAAIEIWLREGEAERKIVFSGDVGNLNQPIIKDPAFVEEADYLVLESTYGSRNHGAAEDVIVSLAGYIEAALSRGGNVVIPSFAVGRTQELLYAIREIKQRKLITNTDFPVYVDSPLAIEATRIFADCDPTYFDKETQALLQAGIDPIGFDGLRLAVSAEESKRINEDSTPKIIISASGMCEAGRIRHHLKHNLWRSQNLILFVGYQAEGTLGRALQEGAEQVRLFGEEIAVRAEIRSLRGTSGHADQRGLLSWVGGFMRKPRIVFLNHGSEESISVLAAELRGRGYAVETPYSGTEYDLIGGIMIAYTERRRKTVHDIARAKSRKASIHGELVSAAEALLALTKRLDGRPNKENAKLTAQIRALIDKWEK
ncbi:MAG: MBL fold metallo-hydrolase [Ruminococcaceae bacterium]|nr:MBL fold metallo-hydrolase [Oscillospiraceae bacterium]MBE6703432.1 MBL fold metallo-hydrolase [Oscillospiraceae bacterium]